MKKILLAGPWVGEFGWELFCWNGYVRALSEHYDETICVSTPYSKFMYEDFCDKFIDFTPNGGSYKDSFYKVGFAVTTSVMKEIFEKAELNTKENKISIFAPRRIGDPPRTHYTDKFKFGENIIIPKYLKFGNKSNCDSYENKVVFHARNRALRSQDNWPIEKWNSLAGKLMKEGYEIISIGLKDEALHIDGTEDMRECDQTELLNILHNSRSIFGPSSGALHLASLCGCPQVVWTTDYNLDRYTKNWNPFSTDVIFLSEQGWQPTVDYVFNKFINWKQ